MKSLSRADFPYKLLTADFRYKLLTADFPYKLLCSNRGFFTSRIFVKPYKLLCPAGYLLAGFLLKPYKLLCSDSGFVLTAGLQVVMFRDMFWHWFSTCLIFINSVLTRVSHVVYFSCLNVRVRLVPPFFQICSNTALLFMILIWFN